MAPIKRKSDAAGQGDRPGKIPKSLASTAISLLKEEAPFPRGGASVLTPLEYKQIKIQAKKDVLFEQTTGKRAPINDYEDAEIDETSGENLHGIEEPKSKKGKVSQKHKKGAPNIGQEKALRIESLSYKARFWTHLLIRLSS